MSISLVKITGHWLDSEEFFFSSTTLQTYFKESSIHKMMEEIFLFKTSPYEDQFQQNQDS